jgi:regulator of RNase E activity RraA
MTGSLVERLKRLDACAISDAMDRIGVIGFLNGIGQISGGTMIAGEAVTVELGPVEDGPAPRHLCTAAVDASGPGKIIVIQHNGRTDVAGWGGILSLGASLRGVEGIVIDGACRDIDETRALGLPMWGRNTVPVTARGRICEKSWNQPITVCGTVVAPGDLIIADGSGALRIPRAVAEDIIGSAETIVLREKLIADAVRGGQSTAEAMGANYETMLQDAETAPVKEEDVNDG